MSAIQKATMLLILAVLLPALASATYYADSIDALGHNGTFSGLFVGSRGTDNYISTSPTGSGNATLYIGNARIITEGMSLNPAGGWYDNGGVVALENPSDRVGIGTSNPLAINGGSATIFHIDAGTGTGDVEVARFEGGADADNTAGIVRIGHSNDRGLILRGGRQTGDIAIGQISLSNSAGAEYPGITLIQRGTASDVGIGTSNPAERFHVSGGNILIEEGYGVRIANSTGTEAPFITTYGPYNNGFGAHIQTGGQLIIGAGESASTAYAQIGSAGSETLWLASDAGVEIVTGVQAGWPNRASFTFGSNGDLSIPGNLTATGDLTANQLILDSVATGDKLSVYGNRLGGTTMYGFGVESLTLYYKSAGNHRWYSGANADGGTSDIMELDSSGNLWISGSMSINGNTAATQTWVTAQGYITSETDGSTSNEIQTLGTSGNTITLSLGGGSVTAPYATSAGNSDTLDSLDSASFLRSDASDTMDAGTSTSLNIISDDTGESVLSLYGASQGTGRVFVGQSAAYGGGIEYNGDGTPASSGSSDHISIFRRSASTDVQVLHWVHNSNTAYFEGDIDLNNNALVNVDWSTSDDGTGSGLDADLLDGQNGAYYLDNTDSQTLGTSGNTITLTNGGSVTAPYATNAGTLDGIDSASFLRSDTPDTLTSTLKVTGGLIHEGSSAIGYVAQPGGGFYQTTTGSVTGAVQVCLPTHGPTDMLKFVVDIYDYTTSESVTAYIAGYAYQVTTGNSWVNPTATVISATSAKDYTVRFGGDGSNNCVWIGETSSVWSYPQVVVRDFMGGYATDIDQYDDGWRVDIVTTLGTVDETVSNNFPYSDWNRMKNIPAGFADGVDADSYPGDLFVNTAGDTMAGTLNMGGNTISGASSIQSSGDNINFFNNRADDTNYEWMGWYSGATRKAILIYDGSWDSCAADSTVCFKAEASNKLHLKSDADTEVEGTNVIVTIG